MKVKDNRKKGSSWAQQRTSDQRSAGVQVGVQLGVQDSRDAKGLVF